jgi:acylphosphatase
MSAEKLSGLHAIVKGHVQGVGFRYFVRQRAQALGAVGWVRNLRDGDVEFVAEAPQPALESLIVAVRQGPRGSEVTDVEIEWGQGGGKFGDFAIKPTA